MCKCGRIDHDAGRNFSCLVDPVDDLVFAVRLVKAKFKSVLAGNLAAIGLDISKRFVAVDVRLAFALEGEVGTVQYVDEAVHGDSDISISSIRMFRNTCGNVAMAGSSDQPDEMKWERMPRGMSGWPEALSTTMSDTHSLWASVIADASCTAGAAATSTAFLPIRWVTACIKSATDLSSTFTDRSVIAGR